MKKFLVTFIASILLSSLVFIAPMPLQPLYADTVAATIRVGSGPQDLTVNPSTNKIYVTNYHDDTVSVIDGSTNTVATIIGVGDAPLGVDVNPITNKVYVTLNIGNGVTVISGSTNSILTTINPFGNPHGVDVNPITNKIYVAQANVRVIDGATDTILATIATPGFGSIAVDVNPITNKIYVANIYTHTVSVIDGSTDTVVGSPIPVGTNPNDIAVNPKTNKIYVSNQNSFDVSVIDGSTNSVVATIPVAVSPSGINVNPNTNKIYVAIERPPPNNLYVIDGSTNTVIETLSVGQNPVDVAVNSKTNKIYVANFGSSDVSVIDAGPLPPDTMPPNTPPVANNATFNINEDESLSGQLTASDIDSSDVLIFSLVSGTSNGEIVVNSDGNFTYQPDANFNGQDTATFEVFDGKAQDQGTITVNIASVNDVPVCSDAKASATSMWPPNHKMKSVNVNMEVTDVDGDFIAVFISSIFQDEPINGIGDGDSSPDAQITGLNSVDLRAERSGDGNGRVYTIMLTADDGNDGTCSGGVQVGVPHDINDVAIDDGATYDSTRP